MTPTSTADAKDLDVVVLVVELLRGDQQQVGDQPGQRREAKAVRPQQADGAAERRRPEQRRVQAPDARRCAAQLLQASDTGSARAGRDHAVLHEQLHELAVEKGASAPCHQKYPTTSTIGSGAAQRAERQRTQRTPAAEQTRDRHARRRCRDA